MDKTPVYIYSAKYAREHGELEVYRASGKADVACKNAIDEAISEHYHDNQLDPACISQVTEKFGFERVMRVLSNTVRKKDWDGRISRDNKAWAFTVPVYPNNDTFGIDRNDYFVLESHPIKIDMYITQARKELAKIHEKEARFTMKKTTPVYYNSFDYADNNGELEQYKASHTANMACHDAIENAIAEHYNYSSHCLGKAAAEEVVV